MSNVDDLRKLLQDLVTPDLKALDARVVALEQKLDLRIEAASKQSEHRYEMLDKKIDARFDTLDRKTDTKFDMVMLEIRSLAAVVAAN